MIDLAQRIQELWPPALLALVQRAAGLARSQGQSLYVVGGPVRDLLLGRPNLDIDLVVEGDALPLARHLAQEEGIQVMTHPRFGTAKFRYREWSLDLVTARSETYPHPGSLPVVRPGTLAQDLFRRDFTINAMAMELSPDSFGRLIDHYGGRADLEKGLIRILHPQSFIDDATRILRALRYEQRLGFSLEKSTEERLRQDAGMLDTISGPRIRHEIELILKEEQPEKVLRRAGELGVLQKISPSLTGDRDLAERFPQARQISPTQPIPLYLCLLIYPLSEKESEQLIARLKFNRATAQSLHHTIELKGEEASLTQPHLPPSQLCRQLQGYYATAIQANALATPSPLVRQRLELFMKRLRYVRPALGGEALIAMGVKPGPRLGRMLQALQDARLDGQVRSRAEAEKMVETWLISGGP